MEYVTDDINLLSDIIKYMAMQFGENCGVVLRGLTLPYNRTIVAIWNGHVTGREVGDDGTNADLQILKGSISPDDRYHYINTTPDGRILRSSDKYFRSEYGKVNGSLCISLDITDLIKCQDSLHLLTCDEGEPSTRNSSEFSIGNIDGLLEEMMNDTILETGKEIKDLTKEEKINIVQSLNKKGFFPVKKSAEIFADFLGLSRYGIYDYLNEIKQHARKYHKANLTTSEQVVTRE